MLNSHKEYLDRTPARDISFRSFMETFSDMRDRQKLIGCWTGDIVPYLQRHAAEDKRRLGTSLKKIGSKDLLAIMDEVLETRKHIEALIPNVSRQEQAISDLHTARVEERCRRVPALIRQENESQMKQTIQPLTAASSTPPGSPSHSVLTTVETATFETAEAQVHVETSPEEAGPFIVESAINNDERQRLLDSIEKASHTQCDWLVDDICVACRFQIFQRECIDALVQSEIKKTEIADVMAIIGVFAPSMATARMKKTFPEKLLYVIARSPIDLPDADLDDGIMMKAVRLYLKGDIDNVSEILHPLNKKDRRIRLMLETLLEYLPRKPIDTISESTFVVKYVAPILQAFVDSEFVKSDFPNTESTTQKMQGLKPDRPDMRALAFGKEICWGEVTGPSQETNDSKNMWDMYRLARFGKAFLDAGNEIAPLFQVVHSNACYMRLSTKARGMFLLEEIGSFIVPTTIAMIPSLFATLPTLLVAKSDIQKIGNSNVNTLKRSWSYKDLENVKKRLL
ncbi:hypothetical protein BGX28_009964 [Mortierella sp. GBA30]|nr:hypothetical protein BGX28_009964 [Mortierella sp. GBA30]